jgi:hypothetical protein
VGQRWAGVRGLSGLRRVGAPFVVPGPCEVAVRDQLKHLTAEDEKVLRLVGDHLGRLACLDLKMRCAPGLEHDTERRPAEHEPWHQDSLPLSL